MEVGVRVVSALRSVLQTRLPNVISQVSACQRCRCYHGPPPLHESIAGRLDRAKKPFVPDESSPFTQEWQKHPDVVKDYKRKAWAKFGSKSGVDLKEIVPTREEISEEWEAEKRWWPSFQELKDAAEKEKKEKEEERAAYEKKVAENMAKMPKWIEQWKVEQEKLKDRELEMLQRREDMRERALEEIDFKFDPDSKQFREYFREFSEKERLEKKKAKGLRNRQKKK